MTALMLTRTGENGLTIVRLTGSEDPQAEEWRSSNGEAGAGIHGAVRGGIARILGCVVGLASNPSGGELNKIDLQL